MQAGGGVGYAFSRLRPKGSLVKSSGGKSSGPVSFMHIYDVMVDVVAQGGKRRGAQMGVLTFTIQTSWNSSMILRMPWQLPGFMF